MPNYLLLLVYLAFCLPTWSNAEQNLNSQIETLIAEQGDINVGILVQNLDNGKIIYERHPHRSFIPASVAKLYTTYGALKYLGPDYKFTTTLLADNHDVQDQILHSNLYLKFSGDPSLTKENLETIFSSLQQLQIKQIVGDIIIDSSLFDNHDSAVGGFTWDDQPFCYAAPKSAIVVNNNCAEGSVQPSQINSLVNITNKDTIALTINNNMKTASTDCNCPFESKYLGNNQYELYGCMPKNWDPVKLNFALPDNHKMIEDYINIILKQKNIMLEGKIIPGVTSGTDILYTHQSPPLTTLLKLVLEDSNNVAAGNIFRTVGAKYTGQEASDKNGVAALYKVLDQNHVNREELALYDGAGESRHNLVSPFDLISLLDHIYQNKILHTHLKELLPICGIEGTVKNRTFKKIKSEYIFAKTGSLTHVSALAGYYLPPNNPQYAFVIMTNNFLSNRAKIKDLEGNLLDILLK
jgi:D-alanyl-D-alanine carboxypeptidase/D-alanyl-D-alanine-endopeptidase (penicillin-binding protein 4)